MIAPGRPALRIYAGSRPPLVASDTSEDVDGDRSLAPLDGDSDGDGMIDGLEDWLPNGIEADGSLVFHVENAVNFEFLRTRSRSVKAWKM